jgi:hypothetical protein
MEIGRRGRLATVKEFLDSYPINSTVAKKTTVNKLISKKCY